MGANTAFTMGYSAVPAEILSGKDLISDPKQYVDELTGDIFTIPGLTPGPFPVWLTLITSMFMHGGWAHLGGNLLYLWIFGDNLENRLGHGRYLAFYMITGIIASLAHIFSTVILRQDALIPSLGASGAISGVLGGYIRLFPTRRVTVLVFWFFISVPAVIVLGLWILLQIFSSVGSLGGMETGSIAYAAHIGGFIAGLLLIGMFAPSIPQVAEKRRSYR
jgi:membrane associated rhomboid family serine protease